ncbi:glycosyltransferase [Novosphingobium sp.]|uniref:glycosyltransferase n=1 Tax=Novosphingobium sp. TaxID=1874826 RepID=UPI002FDED75A
MPNTADPRRRLYVDLAVLSRHDAGTGIQRVVRALALALASAAGDEWDVRFVSATRKRGYRVIDWPRQCDPAGKPDMQGRPGDIFFGLDFSLDAVRFHRGDLARFRRDGGKLWFLVCDLLPAERPEWFSTNLVIRYKAWIEIIAGLAEGFLCISTQTKEDLTRVLSAHLGLDGGYRTALLPMGYDIRQSMVSAPDSAPVTSRVDLTAPFTLMVGTLEPRKGHADVVEAFDILWSEGSDARLVLVGRAGWKNEAFITSLREHAQFGTKLIWLPDVDDAELESIYSFASSVIIASHAEGFGLPLIEALGHNKPVLARDLPIFRMHEHLGVRYFAADATSTQRAATIAAWLEDAATGKITVRAPEGDWTDSALQTLAAFG